jgi:hypothetical protein
MTVPEDQEGEKLRVYTGSIYAGPCTYREPRIFGGLARDVNHFIEALHSFIPQGEVRRNIVQLVDDFQIDAIEVFQLYDIASHFS